MKGCIHIGNYDTDLICNGELTHYIMVHDGGCTRCMTVTVGVHTLTMVYHIVRNTRVNTLNNVT